MVEKLKVGRQLPDGRTVTCSLFALSKGDFVDVGVELDISTSRAPNRHMRNSVHLSIVHVLQLLPASLVQEVGNFFLVRRGGI